MTSTTMAYSNRNREGLHEGISRDATSAASQKIPVIDIFAGPGGLGEGFSSVEGIPFDVRLSIEMNANAHQTLELRSFVHQFGKDSIPEEYYDMMKEGNLEKRAVLRQNLFNQYPDQSKIAKDIAWQCELGGDKFTPKEVDERISEALAETKDWVLIGGPPCQAYSLVGRSRRQWKDNLDTDDPRVHLYKEYLRIIAKHHPSVFVMENVKGLLSAKLDGEKIFHLILRDLQDPGSVFAGLDSPRYKIYSLVTPAVLDDAGNPVYNQDTDYLIRAENYGVPQKRHRVILLGIRADLDVEPKILDPAKKKVVLKDVISDLPKVRSGINRSFVRSEMVVAEDGTEKKKRYYKNEEDSSERWKELVSRFRTEIISWNGFAANYGKSTLKVPEVGIGSEFVPCETPGKDNPLRKWYEDKRLRGAANHESRSHLLQDLKRYLFSSMFTETYERFPRLHEYNIHSKALLPDHENAESGKFADRFRVQLPNEPATTVTSHISKDGHYFIHYDSNQCRSLTVREAARIQTFPDNYLFCGSRTAQYHQVGNAVPPYLAKQIGEVVFGVFEQRNEQ